MAGFAANVTASISGDGLTVTVEDISPYGAGNNDQNYTTANFTRQAILTDAYTQPIDTLNMVGDELTADEDITKDGWIVIELVCTGVGDEGVFTKTVEIPCDRITKNLFRTLLNQGCCVNGIIDKRLEFAREYLIGAEIEALAGDGPGFNIDITNAYAYLTAPKF